MLSLASVSITVLEFVLIAPHSCTHTLRMYAAAGSGFATVGLPLSFWSSFECSLRDRSTAADARRRHEVCEVGNI